MGRRTIIHISDIHIGSSKGRSQEYRAVFDKLRQEIVRARPLAVCITGDIFHNKNRYSGADVSDFYYLLEAIAPTPIIITPGNHDMNLNNVANVDLISPLLSKMQNSTNIHYWIETGIYNLGGVSFLCIGLTEDITTGRIKQYINDNPTAIVLYHGMADGAEFGNIRVSGTKLTDEILMAAQMVFLGDIHEHQFIKKHVAYAGSLIQQNLGETDKKGYILWDLDGRTGIFKQIYNEKKYIRLDLRGKTPAEAKKMIGELPAPQNILKMSIITDAVGQSYIDQMKDFDGQTHVVKWVNKHKKRPQEDYEAMLRAILKKNGGTEAQIAYIVEKYRGRIIKQERRKWTIKTLQWNYLYRYGGGNFIDFGALNGISGIIAPNRAGKTTILDILLLGLFGRIIRGIKKNIIHFGEKMSYVKIEFVANDNNYIVERSDDTTHTNMRLYQCKGLQKINISEVSTPETYKKIESLIGTYDQFLTTGLYYDGINDIIKMDKAERFKILPGLFGLEDGNIIIKEMKARLKELKAESLKLGRPHVEAPEHELAATQKKLESMLLKHADLQGKVDRLTEKYSQLKGAADLQKELKGAQRDLEQLRSKESKARGQIKIEIYQLTEQEQAEYRRLVVDEKKYRREAAAVANTVALQVEKEVLVRELAVATAKKLEPRRPPPNDLLLATVNKLKKELVFSYSTCALCARNLQRFNEIVAECGALPPPQSRNERTVAQIKRDIAAIERAEVAAKAREYVDKLDQYVEKCGQIKLCTAQRQLAIEIAEREAKIKQLAPKIISSAEYNTIAAELQANKTDLNKVNRVIGYLKAEIDRLSAEIVIKANFEKNNRRLMGEIDVLQLYIKSVGADGLQIEIIKSNMLNIIDDANRILSNITGDFKLTCRIEDKRVDIFIDSGNYEIPVDMGSGFERFIIGLVLRMVITNNMYTSPDFLMIDEGFGRIDAENLKRVEEAITQIKDNYSYIFLISHIDSIENIIEHPIYIFKDADNSYINTKCKSRNQVEVVNFVKQHVGGGYEVKKFEAPSDKIQCVCGRKILRRGLNKHILTKFHRLRVGDGNIKNKKN